MVWIDIGFKLHVKYIEIFWQGKLLPSLGEHKNIEFEAESSMDGTRKQTFAAESNQAHFYIFKKDQKPVSPF